MRVSRKKCKQRETMTVGRAVHTVMVYSMTNLGAHGAPYNITTLLNYARSD